MIRYASAGGTYDRRYETATGQTHEKTRSIGRGHITFVSTTLSGKADLPDDPFAGYESYAVADWDGYGAVPISPETLESAVALLKELPIGLRKPDIAPGADGSIGFEWDFETGSVTQVYLDVGPGRVMSAVRRYRNGTFETWPAKNLVTQIARLLPTLFIHE